MRNDNRKKCCKDGGCRQSFNLHYTNNKKKLFWPKLLFFYFFIFMALYIKKDVFIYYSF